MHQINHINSSVKVYHTPPLTVVPPPMHNSGVLDTGCNDHCITANTDTTSSHPAAAPLSVQLPNGERLLSTDVATLNLPSFPPVLRQSHVFPAMTSYPLISVPKLCDHGCTVTFTSTNAFIHRDNQLLLTVPRHHTTKLWHMDLSADHPGTTTAPLPTSPPQQHCYHILPTRNNSDLLKWLHQSMFSPSPTTLIKAIRNRQLITFPGLTIDNVRKHLPPSVATAKGHLDQVRKNIQSTKPNDTHEDLFPTPDPTPSNQIFAVIVDLTSDKTYSDLTGRFPFTSSSGNKYILVLYHFHSNAILATPLKGRTDTHHTEGLEVLLRPLLLAGFKPDIHMMDNEASQKVKNFLTLNKIAYQLAPPHIHRRNIAERAIRTFKNHFISGLATTDKLFPIHLWDKLIQQCVLTLNLLRRSRCNPNLSAHAQLFGNFDFNQSPLAPPGTRILIHEKPNQRRTWAPHGVQGWYIGPALEHYRCYKCYVTTTNATRISDTVEFFPTQCEVPALSSTDTAMLAARQLIHALQHPQPASPFIIAPADQQCILDLAALFQRSVLTKHTPPGQPEPRVPPIPKTIPPRVSPQPPITTAAVLPPRVPPLATHPVNPRYNLRPRQQANAVHATPSPSHHRLYTNYKHHAVEQLQFLPPFRGHSQPHTSAQYHSDICAAVFDDAGKKLNYRQLIGNPATNGTWSTSAANEFGRLAQGVGDRITGTDTIFFITKDQMPADRRATYMTFVCDHKPHKKEKDRTRIVVGGDLVDYPGDVSTRTADLTTIKLLFNSVVSTPGAKFMSLDIGNFYLNTPLTRYEYIRCHISQVPEEIIIQYQLRDKQDKDGYVYMEVRKGMYGLPQAGILANKLLESRLNLHGYAQMPLTNGLWRHKTRPITFSLVVDDFGIKYVNVDDVLHLKNILLQHYPVTEDWTGALYCGLTLHWNYTDRWVDLSMPGYIKALLLRFQHPSPSQPQFSPHACAPPNYGQQLTPPDDSSAPIDAKGITRIQSIVGALLFYARAIDTTLPVTLSTIASKQAKATKLTVLQTTQLLDYMATHPDATLRYYASDMVLHIHSDGSYLSVDEARSRAGGHFFLANKPTLNRPVLNNGAILTVASIIKVVLASAAECELGSLFFNCKEGTVLRHTLHELGHPQPPTPVETDNKTASGIANGTCKQIRSKAIDMRFYWIRDRIKQGHFHVYWAPGAHNMADYSTKHHPTPHHIKMRPFYLHTPSSPKYLPHTFVPANPLSSARVC